MNTRQPPVSMQGREVPACAPPNVDSSTRRRMQVKQKRCPSAHCSKTRKPMSEPKESKWSMMEWGTDRNTLNSRKEHGEDQTTVIQGSEELLQEI